MVNPEAYKQVNKEKLCLSAPDETVGHGVCVITFIHGWFQDNVSVSVSDSVSATVATTVTTGPVTTQWATYHKTITASIKYYKSYYDCPQNRFFSPVVWQCAYLQHKFVGKMLQK